MATKVQGIQKNDTNQSRSCVPKSQTQARNARRKRSTKLTRLKHAKVLPANADFAAMTEWESRPRKTAEKHKKITDAKKNENDAQSIEKLGQHVVADQSVGADNGTLNRTSEPSPPSYETSEAHDQGTSGMAAASELHDTVVEQSVLE